MPLDFSNPAQGPLGSGLAQNAGAALNWNAAYKQYVIDEQTEGRAPLPLPLFIQEVGKAAALAQQQGQPAVPAVPPGLMPAPRGLMR